MTLDKNFKPIGHLTADRWARKCFQLPKELSEKATQKAGNVSKVTLSQLTSFDKVITVRTWSVTECVVPGVAQPWGAVSRVYKEVQFWFSSPHHFYRHQKFQQLSWEAGLFFYQVFTVSCLTFLLLPPFLFILLFFIISSFDFFLHLLFSCFF